MSEISYVQRTVDQLKDTPIAGKEVHEITFTQYEATIVFTDGSSLEITSWEIPGDHGIELDMKEKEKENERG